MDKKLVEKLEELNTEDLMKLLVKKMGYEFSKENIIEEKSEDYMQRKEEIYSGYLEGFDEEFETHIKNRIKETPLLMELFNKFAEEIYKPNTIQEISNKICSRIESELDKTLNKEQKKLFEQWKFCEDKLSNDLAEQSFIYGYLISTELREEARKQYPYKEKE